MQPTTPTTPTVAAVRVPGFRDLYEEYRQLPFEDAVQLLFDFDKPRQVLDAEPVA